MTAFVPFSWQVPFPLTVLDYYLRGSHYCSCCRNIQAFLSKMHQGVVAFIFCLAKVFIDVLRKSHKEHFTAAVWSMVPLYTFRSASFLAAFYEFLFSLCYQCFGLSYPFALSVSSWRISCLRIKSRGKTVENNSTISLTPLILGTTREINSKRLQEKESNVLPPQLQQFSFLAL